MRARTGWSGLLLVVAVLGCSGLGDGAAEEAAGGGDDGANVEATGDTADEDAADEVVDDDPSAEEEAASGDKEPEVALGDGAAIPVGAVPPALYRTGVFKVPASFEVFDDGWYADREDPFAVALYGEEADQEPGVSLITLQVPTSVDELVAELEALASDTFVITDKGPTSLGGLDGTVLEASLTRSMAFEPLRSTSGQWVTSAEDARLSIHVLETGASPVLVWINAERAVYPNHLERVRPILESLLFAP